MTSCYCDHEPASVYQASRPCAHREHKCSECGQTISPGETYERVWAIWDGYVQVAKTCCNCLAIRDALATMDCFCWAHNSLWEDIGNQLDNADFKPGARFGYLRMVATHPGVRKRRDRRRSVSTV